MFPNNSVKYIFQFKRLSGWVIAPLGALLLAACGGDSSDKPAQELPLDLGLEQCEVAVGGEIGTPTDPVMVNGVETQACLLSGQFTQNVKLKNTHNYEPLVWILEGVVEIGESKQYATQEELLNDSITLFQPVDAQVFAREKAVLVVHRNGKFAGATGTAGIRSVDSDSEGGGEWGGVVVNGLGYHPDCPDATEADAICNILGTWGYFGGFYQAEGQVLSQTTGFSGAVIEAGGSVDGDNQLNAALTFNAPLLGQNISIAHVFYSGGNGIEINGGNANISPIGKDNAGHFAYWKNGFSGKISNGVVYHSNSNLAAFRGEGGGEAVISQLTLVDKDYTAGLAIHLSNGTTVNINQLVVQGFTACLQIDDAATRLTSDNNVLFCDSTTAPGIDGTDYAQQALAQATNLSELDPDLSVNLIVSNNDISLPAIPGGAGSAVIPNLENVYGYNLSFIQDDCLGVGTLLDETRVIGNTTYRICELEGSITKSFVFDDDVNDDPVVWVLKGQVTLGEDITGFTDTQREILLANPQRVRKSGRPRVFGRPNSSLVINPGVSLDLKGSATTPFVISSFDEGEGGIGEWGGIVINGLNSEDDSIELRYLRVLEAGQTMPALTLNNLGADVQLSYIDIVGSSREGMVINGGNVNIDNLIITDVVGNQLQWSQGYRGTLQYAVLKAGDASIGHALVGRNNAENHDALPRSRPAFANITLMGTEQTDTAILLEQGSGLLLYNSVVTDFSHCLDFDDAATAALQSGSPQEIFFSSVVLDCTQTLAADNEIPTTIVEEEDGLVDYADVTRFANGEGFEVAAALDAQYVPSGPQIPQIPVGIDFSLVGDGERFLNSEIAYMGTVQNARDNWYLGWSDAIGVLLAEECDFKGALEDDYVYIFQSLFDSNGNNVQIDYKVCGLRGTIRNDATLTRYTGIDAIAFANGETISTGGVEHDPVPTIWVFNGMVHVGEGNLLITDLEEVKAMKEDPVTLELEAGVLVMASENGGLHITRGGALYIKGDEHLQEEINTSGPVSLFGRVVEDDAFDDLEPFAPFSDSKDVRPWKGLIVDGFGRNNQCPDADTAEPNTQICNIEGEYGYYGGYDNDHRNLVVENLYMDAGRLVLNSVGRGSEIHNYRHTGRTDDDEITQDRIGTEVIAIDGGAVNFVNVYLDNMIRHWGTMISWHHGYQGTLQNIHIRGYLDQTYLSETDGPYLFPVIKGLNGETGNEHAKPRSMPTIANLSIDMREYDPFPNEDSYYFELSQGSGLFLYNSVVGTRENNYDENEEDDESVDYCLNVDVSSETLVGSELVINNFAYSCKQLSNNSSFISSLLAEPSTEIFKFDYAFAGDSADDFIELEFVDVLTDWDSMYYPAEAIIGLGKKVIDYSTSKTVDTTFISDTNYFGDIDYFLVTENNGDIGD